MVNITSSLTGAGSIEETKDLGTGDEALWEFWSTQEDIALRGERSWRNKGRQIVKRYRDQRSEDDGVGGTPKGLHRFNILWSNVETLKPVLYGRCPAPDVQRRFKDQDDTGRLASMILERTLSYEMQMCDFDGVMKAIVEDRLLPGRGVPRVLYVPHFGDPIDEMGSADENVAGSGDAASTSLVGRDAGAPPVVPPGGTTPPAPPGGAPYLATKDGAPIAPLSNALSPATETEALREVVWEEVLLSYVYWEDYLEGPARTWKEVPWTRYRAYMTRDEMIKRFGKAKAMKVKLDFVSKGTETGTKAKADVPDDIYKKAIIHETWDKRERRVIWWAPGTSDLILDQVDDPLELTDFFPGPDPLFSTKTNDKRIPVPDYIEYQDQAIELDTITGRLDRLVRAIKVAGVYPGSEKAVLQQLFDPGTDNRLIPVPDWPTFTGDKGGLDKMIQWMPIQQVVEVVIQLYNARDKVKQVIYEITGISDIIRAATSPVETAQAQDLKARFSTLRISPQQKAVADIARNSIRIMASVIMQNFSEKTFTMITGLPVLLPVPKPPMPVPTTIAQSAPAPPPGQPAPPMMGGMVQVPNPAFAQYQQQIQQIQTIVSQNQQIQSQFSAAIKMLRDDAHEGFKVDIEVDSTVAVDEQQDRQDRVQFLSEFIPLLQQGITQVQGNPAMAGLVKEITLFAMRGFKIARSLEETVEKAFDMLAKMPPDPNAKGGKGGADAEAQAQMVDAKVKAGMAQQELSTKVQIAQQEDTTKRLELSQEGTLRSQELALQAQHQEEQRRISEARVLSADARSASGIK